MFEPHEGTLKLKNKFQKVYNWLEKYGPSEIITKRGTDFVAQAEITQKGPHSGEKVIRFMLDNNEFSRTYKCCWWRYYNCNRAPLECTVQLLMALSCNSESTLIVLNILKNLPYESRSA
jgi:hypothetical protein